MSLTITTDVVGNEQVLTLIRFLADAGIPRERIRVCEPDTAPEHGSDAVSSLSLGWGVLGGLAGAAIGALIMSWSALPQVGALWGLVVGAICGARFGGYLVVPRRIQRRDLPSTRIEIDTDDPGQAEDVRRICREAHARDRIAPST